MSVQDITNHYEMMSIKISHMVVCKWIAKYSRMVEKYLNEIIPRTVDRNHKSSKRVFGKETEHHSHIHLRKDRNNNKMERFNGTFRDRELVFRNLKKSDIVLIGGHQAFYNYTKKHIGLGGKTPAEDSNIKVDGPNKW